MQSFKADGTRRDDVKVPRQACRFQPGKGRVLIATASQADGKWVATPQLQTMTTDGKLGEPITLSRPVGNIQFMRCDHDGDIYMLAGTNQLFIYDADGKLKKIIGGGTELRLQDGSELYDSVAVDSHDNVYSMSGQPRALTRSIPA